jgi:hypothetical protein
MVNNQNVRISYKRLCIIAVAQFTGSVHFALNAELDARTFKPKIESHHGVNLLRLNQN